MPFAPLARDMQGHAGEKQGQEDQNQVVGSVELRIDQEHQTHQHRQHMDRAKTAVHASLVVDGEAVGGPEQAVGQRRATG